MTDDDIQRLPPELWQPAIAAAVRYFNNFGEPGSPGNRQALFDIVKVIIRYSHVDEAVAEPVRTIHAAKDEMASRREKQAA